LLLTSVGIIAGHRLVRDMEKKGSARRSNYIFEYRIAVLGSSCVGKTSLIKRFIGDEFVDKHVPTIEDHFQHVVNLSYSTCVCLLMDTSGTFEFPAMKNWSISKANAFVVVYSIANKKSFEQAKALVEDIKRVKGDGADIKIVLIGNKLELQGSRKVSKETGEAFAKDVSSGNVTCELIETSAKDNTNITEAFHSLLNMFLSEHGISEESSDLSPSEKRRGSFSRTLSLRRAHKNRKEKSRQKNAEKKKWQNRSNENLLDVVQPLPRSRSQSLDTDKALSNSSSDSDSRPSSPTETHNNNIDHKELKRQSSAKELLRRTTSACKEKLDQAKKRLHRGHKLSKGSDDNQTSIEIAEA